MNFAVIRLGNQLSNPRLVRVANDHRHARKLDQLFRRTLRVAPGDHDPGIGILAMLGALAAGFEDQVAVFDADVFGAIAGVDLEQRGGEDPIGGRSGMCHHDRQNCSWLPRRPAEEHVPGGREEEPGEDAAAEPGGPVDQGFFQATLAAMRNLAVDGNLRGFDTRALSKLAGKPLPYSGVISIFAERARTGKELVIFGDGLQSRDFVYVADVVRALADCALCE